MRDAPRMYRALKWLLPRTLAPYLPVTVEGLEHVPEVEPVVLASNHRSFIDSLIIPISIPRPVYYLAKADYFDSWRTRWFFRGAGTVPTRRTSTGGDGALQTGVEILRSGDPVGVYPEGTRSPDGRLYRGKTGPVRMALEAGVRIVPIALIGTDQVQPTGSYGVRRHPVTMRIGAPIDLSRYAEQKDDPFVLRAATDELMFEIMRMSGQTYVDEYASNVKSGAVDVDGTPAPEVREDREPPAPGPVTPDDVAAADLDEPGGRSALG